MTKVQPLQSSSTAEWSEEVLLAGEKEVLGLYLSGHPLRRYRDEMGSYITCTLGRLPESGTVRVAGHVLSARRMTTKKGNLMARFVLEDLDGELEITVFPKTLTPEVNALLAPGMMLVVKGQVETREAGETGESRQLLAEEIIPFLAARERFVRLLNIIIPADSDDVVFNQLKEVFGKYPGLCHVHLHLRSAEGNTVIETRAGIKPTDAFIADLQKVLGPDCWSFGKKVGSPTMAEKRPAGQLRRELAGAGI